MGIDKLFNHDDDHRKHKHYEDNYNENGKALKDHADGHPVSWKYSRS